MAGKQKEVLENIYINNKVVQEREKGDQRQKIEGFQDLDKKDSHLGAKGF
jgi:hypothetical protein